jgi:hypothetical protein
MNIVHEIAKWAKAAPKWQSDAIRRIFTQDAFSSTDEDELLQLLLAEHGIIEGDDIVPEPKPFADLVSDSAGAVKQVVLKEIHSVSGVNALVPDQSIAFNVDGMTIIYGENGAGKSGYARIFKHACSAREKSIPILANVSAKTNLKPLATIEVSVDGEDVAIEWTAGAPASELLAEIAVFDSHCARVFLDEANEVTYLPYGMDVFSRLALLCGSLKKKIQSRLATLPLAFTAIQQFREGTDACAFIRSLSDKSDVARLERLVALNNDEKSRLQNLKALVAAAKANPPKQKAVELRRKNRRLESLLTAVIAIESGLADSAIVSLRNLAGAAASTTEAERLASIEAFRTDPLPGTGRDAWRILFDAAKVFSEQDAYSGRGFPVVDDGAVCVLCQQALQPKASDRLTRFQRFIVNDAATKKLAADNALATVLMSLRALNVQPFAADPTLLDELTTDDEALATTTVAFIAQATTRKEATIKAVADGQWQAIPPLLVTVTAELRAAISALEACALEFDQADNPQEFQKLQKELAELEDRELLHKLENEVRTLIAAKKREAALRNCDRACDTGAITRFGTQLMEEAVTPQLIAALGKELKFFDTNCVPVKLAKKGDKGKTKHQLTIAGGAPPSGVLSEGEQRVVAIAAFLAELDTAGRSLPIIFDDPVSSLDHLFRERVAKRLAQEAASKRQVIVFTHDIVMLLALEAECHEQGCSPQVHTVRRSMNGPGECPRTSSRPWHLSNTKDRIGFLKQASAGFNKLSQQSPEDYRIAVAELFGKLREAWERAIEEVLLGNVVQRFRPSIHTTRLGEIVVESDDYAAIECGMSKCSAELTGHDRAAAKNAPPPTPEDVKVAITALESFVDIIKKRQQQRPKAADSLVAPRKPNLMTVRASKVICLATADATA